MSDVYTFPLSLAQERLWILSHFGGGSEAYTISAAYEVTSRIDPDILDRSLRVVLERHEALRTTFKTFGADAVQVVSNAIQDPLSWTRLPASDPELCRTAIADELAALSNARFDLENGPLVRVRLLVIDEQRAVISLAMHHIVADGWSIRVFLTELAEAYAATAQGRPIELPPLSIQLADFAVWQRNQLDGEPMRARVEFWKRYLAGAPTFLPLPTDRPRPALQSFNGGLVAFQLDPGVVDSVRDLAQASRATMFMALFSAFALLLSRYTEETDLVVGCPSHGRDAAELQSVIGLFVNTLILRVDLSGDPSFREILNRVRGSVLAAQAEAETPLEKIVEALGVETNPSHNPLFQVMFSYDAEDLSAFQFADLSLRQIPMDNRPSKFDVTMVLVESSGGIRGELEFKRDLFDSATIERMSAHFQRLLRGIADNPDAPARSIDMITPEEQARFRQWNTTARAYPRGLRIQDLVLSRAARGADATAIEFVAARMSYRELTERAARFARILQLAGAGPETAVGISLRPSADMIVSVLGTLMAGAAYVPLDPSVPVPRLDYMLKDAGIAVLVCDSTTSASLRAVCARVDWAIIRDEIEHGAPQPVACSATDSNLAYLIYTSGSTGVPKAVQVEHRSVVNLLLSMAEALDLRESDKFLAVTPLSFDISVLELFLPLIAGGRVSIVSRESATNGERLASVIRDSGATWMQATPSTWQLLREAGWEGSDRLNVLSGGEALPEDLARWLVARVSSLRNMYGPTETTIWSLVHRVTREDPRVMIGRPVANTRVYVLDGHLQQVPLGVPGELCISGSGLARGYRHDEQKTAATFVANRFDVGSLMYRTGDRVRFGADGVLEFLGRSDTQVKFRGHRIDLGDIEANLRALPTVREAVVVLDQESSSGPRLVAYVVPEAGPPGPRDLRVLLGMHLPDYMIPTVFELLDALPLTANGKVDRKLLPRPSRPAETVEFTAPRNDIERTLAPIWADVLGVTRIGVHDSFLALGGASLQCVRIVNRARQAGLTISPEQIFELQSIAAVAATLGGHARIPFEANPIADDIEPFANIDVATYFADTDAAPPRDAVARVVVESLGMYLPPNVVSSDDVVNKCRSALRFPLQRVTGIKSRRMALGEQFSLDIARKAVADALSRSRYRAGDIDLLVSCSISRFDGPNENTFEPTTAARLAADMGFSRAITFDVSNGCAGLFTGLYVANALLTQDIVRTAVVLSGEYITHLTATAQREITDYLDSRIACLTLGDSGVALVLERGSGRAGFQFFDMFTYGAYSKFCIAKSSDEDSGAIMYTDAVAMADKGFEPGARHTLESLKRARWKPESIDHLIMHQTATITIDTSKREINKLFGKNICNDRNLINNLAERGNTATTSHFVALMDHIQNGNISSDANVLFSISGSGMTFGTALYTLDDLPDRIRQRQPDTQSAPPADQTRQSGRTPPSGIRIMRAAKAAPPLARPQTLDLLASASRACLDAANVDKSAIDILIYSGVYRSDFIVEPAIASMLAGELGMNATPEDATANRTLAFDVLDGAVGFLKACFVASGFIQAGVADVAMVVTAEVENNRSTGEPLIGFAEMGSAVIVARPAAMDGTGFAGFYFEQTPAQVGALRAHWSCDRSRHFIRFVEDRRLHDMYIGAVARALPTFLEREQMSIGEISRFFPPQISPAFVARLAAALEIPLDRFVVADDAGGDLHTSSIPAALHDSAQRGTMSPGDIGLFIAVGSGIQVGLALYYF